MTISIKFVTKSNQKSNYDFVNFEIDGMRIGKSRCKIYKLSEEAEKAVIIIYNINIYPEWQNRGYGKQFVIYCKCRYATVIADRVRPTAIGFWKAMEFYDDKNGNYIYNKNLI